MRSHGRSTVSRAASADDGVMQTLRSLLRRRSVRLALAAVSAGGALALFLAVAHPAQLWRSLAALPPGAALAAVAAALIAPRLPALRGRLQTLLEGLAVFRTPRAVAPALAVSAGIWLADVVMYGALAHGFGLGANIGTIVLLVGAGNLALAIPGAAAGLGSFELVTLAGAHGIGAGGPTLAAFVLAVHAVIVLPPTLIGALLARVSLPRSLRSQPETALARS